jgi:FlaA1/EpsC-like NDP-sugar epimerase
MIQLAGLTPDRDIAIRFSGLRPGEKMYEELFKASENLLPTHHPKILKAQRCEVDLRFSERLADLVTLALTHDDEAIAARVRDIVPEYLPSIAPGTSPSRQMKPVPAVLDRTESNPAPLAVRR